MRTISLQGTSLSRSQRERLQQQQGIKSSFLNPVLAQSVQATLDTLERTRDQPFVDIYKFNIVEHKSVGTVSIAEWMGY
jgi:hypothetical protein